MFQKSPWLFLSVALSLLILGYCFFSPSALVKARLMKSKEAQLLNDIVQLRAAISTHQLEIRLLKGTSEESKLYIERLARDNMSYLKPNELLLFVDD